MLAECMQNTFVRSLIDQYMIDFLIDKPFLKLPKCWQEFLGNLEESTVYRLCDPSTSLNCVLPLGLICLRTISSSLTEARAPVEKPQEIAGILGVDVKSVPESFVPLWEDGELNRKVKRKKLHELVRICHLVRIAKQKQSFSCVVDVGAGLGHLSRFLALSLPETRIHTIEGNDVLVQTASFLDERFKRRLDSFDGPLRKSEYVRLDKELELPQSESGMCLVGVHACGDLSSSIITMFAEHPQAKTLVLFGCCFHKLNGGRDKLFRQIWEESNDESTTCGYPLHGTSPSLSYAARELACHNREQFVETKDANIGAQVYRAILETSIVECTGQRHLQVKGVKQASTLLCEEYARKALAGYPELVELVCEKLANSTVDVASIVEKESRPFLCMIVLRLLLAPIVESAILRDRVRYLRERGIETHTMSVFDPLQSPRNYCIVAFKK